MGLTATMGSVGKPKINADSVGNPTILLAAPWRPGLAWQQSLGSGQYPRKTTWSDSGWQSCRDPRISMFRAKAKEDQGEGPLHPEP